MSSFSSLSTLITIPPTPLPVNNKSTISFYSLNNSFVHKELTYLYPTMHLTNKSPLIKLPPFSNMCYLTIPWPSCGPLSSEFSSSCWFWHTQGELGFILTSSTGSRSMLPPTSKISVSFQSLKSINNSYALLHKEYSHNQIQTIRTLTYQLDLMLETLLTTCKKIWSCQPPNTD